MIPKKAIQEGNFNRAGGDTGQQDNWGLLRHIADNNISESTADPVERMTMYWTAQELMLFYRIVE